MKEFSIGIILLLVISLAGCSSPPEDSNSIEQGTTVNGSGLTEPPEMPGDSSTAAALVTGETTTIVLYFTGGDGNLAPEQREVPKVTGIARKTMEELCEGPQTEGLQSTLPAGTELLDINIRDGLCTVDFTQELVGNHPGGSSGELLTVYSIVNTLTQFPSIHQVAFLIDGEQVETLAGHMDLTVPLERNPDILKG